MAANRAEISVRIQRAATELNAGTVAIYVHEDRYSQHRTCAVWWLCWDEDMVVVSAVVLFPFSPSMSHGIFSLDRLGC